MSNGLPARGFHQTSGTWLIGAARCWMELLYAEDKIMRQSLSSYGDTILHGVVTGNIQGTAQSQKLNHATTLGFIIDHGSSLRSDTNLYNLE